MPITVITFDLDNTLWDVEPAILRAEEAQQAWLREHRPGTADDMDHEALWEFKKSVWKRHPELVHHVSQMRRQTLYELQLRAGYSQEESLSGATEAFDVFLRERHKVELYEMALGVLETLAQSFRLGALTNGNADIYKTDAGEYFDFAFLAEDIGAAKPHPDMFDAALAEAGVQAHEVIHVGDDPEHDVRGAIEAGMHSVWVNLRNKPWSGEQRADQEINDLLQLPAAIRSIARGS